MGFMPSSRAANGSDISKMTAQMQSQGQMLVNGINTGIMMTQSLGNGSSRVAGTAVGPSQLPLTLTEIDAKTETAASKESISSLLA